MSTRSGWGGSTVSTWIGRSRGCWRASARRTGWDSRWIAGRSTTPIRECAPFPSSTTIGPAARYRTAACSFRCPRARGPGRAYRGCGRMPLVGAVGWGLRVRYAPDGKRCEGSHSRRGGVERHVRRGGLFGALRHDGRRDQKEACGRARGAVPAQTGVRGLPEFPSRISKVVVRESQGVGRVR